MRKALQFYTRTDCTLCHSALAVVQRVQKRIGFPLEVIHIDTNPTLTALYGVDIPVLKCGDIELARTFIDEKTLIAELNKLA